MPVESVTVSRLVMVVAFFAVSAFLSAVDVQELGTGLELLGGHVRCVCVFLIRLPLLTLSAIFHMMIRPAAMRTARPPCSSHTSQALHTRCMLPLPIEVHIQYSCSWLFGMHASGCSVPRCRLTRLAVRLGRRLGSKYDGMAPEHSSSALLRTHVFDRAPPVDLERLGLVVDPHPAAVALARRTNTFPGEVCAVVQPTCLLQRAQLHMVPLCIMRRVRTGRRVLPPPARC